MKKLMMVTAAMLLASAPAHAWVKVTNLSGKPQTVSIESAGAKTTKVIAPNVTESFIMTDGMMSLDDPASVQKAKNAEAGPGGKILGDVIASNRTSRIPTSYGENYVIWPDGRILIQTKKGRKGWTF